MNDINNSFMHEVPIIGRDSDSAGLLEDKFCRLKDYIGQRVIGQRDLIEMLLVGMLTGGHVLIEGVPGLAKTTVACALAEAVEGEFSRVQFTPDLLPSDIIGTEIYIHDKADFTFRAGPVFCNILLADEINRAPAKVQSALLEAMEERQVSVGNASHLLPGLFMVIATQNPIEQEGTYNLPEAQLDRFMMNIVVNYPSYEEELKILKLPHDVDSARVVHKDKKACHTLSEAELFDAQRQVSKVYVSDAVLSYIVSLARATRYPADYDEKLSKYIEHGVSPRASIALMHCAKAFAWLHRDSFVSPYHVQKVLPHIFRHRIGSSFEADSEGLSVDDMIARLLQVVAIS